MVVNKQVSTMPGGVPRDYMEVLRANQYHFVWRPRGAPRGASALEVPDAVLAQPGALGERVLEHAEGQPVVPQHLGRTTGSAPRPALHLTPAYRTGAPAAETAGVVRAGGSKLCGS